MDGEPSGPAARMLLSAARLSPVPLRRRLTSQTLADGLARHTCTPAHLLLLDNCLPSEPETNHPVTQCDALGPVPLRAKHQAAGGTPLGRSQPISGNATSSLGSRGRSHGHVNRHRGRCGGRHRRVVRSRPALRRPGGASAIRQGAELAGPCAAPAPRPRQRRQVPRVQPRPRRRPLRLRLPHRCRWRRRRRQADVDHRSNPGLDPRSGRGVCPRKSVGLGADIVGMPSTRHMPSLARVAEMASSSSS